MELAFRLFLDRSSSVTLGSLAAAQIYFLNLSSSWAVLPGLAPIHAANASAASRSTSLFLRLQSRSQWQQHTAEQCVRFYIMVWHGMGWDGMAWHGMVWDGMVWYGMVWYGMVWYSIVWHGVVWYGRHLILALPPHPTVQFVKTGWNLNPLHPTVDCGKTGRPQAGIVLI